MSRFIVFLVLSMLTVGAYAFPARALGEQLLLAGVTNEFTDESDLAMSVCNMFDVPDYQCSGGVDEAICVVSGRSSYECSGEGIAASICISSGLPSYSCTTKKLPEAVCIAGGNASYKCSANLKPGEAICIARGYPAYKCSSSLSIEDALQLEVKDINWEWDELNNGYGGSDWRCRGTNTGQFAKEQQCSGKVKKDDVWVN